MLFSNKLIYVLALASMAILQFCNKEIPYEVLIEKQRLEKDFTMRNSEGSPFAHDIYSYKGLEYFPPDEKFKVVARYQPYTGIEKVSLPTSDNLTREYYKYGYAEFELGGVNNKLLIFQPVTENMDAGGLFLGFGDATSANETYGAGRYLDIKHNGGKTITLDFNLAYNPYCAYSDAYSCPIPPRENFLSIPVYAGEKDYKRH